MGYSTPTGEGAVHLSQGKNPATGSCHQAVTVLQFSALAFPHSKFPSNPKKEKVSKTSSSGLFRDSKQPEDC